MFSMEKLENAIKCFNEENFSKAEQFALEIYAQNPLSTENLDFLYNAGKQELDLIRKIAFFLFDLKTFKQAEFFFKKALEIYPVDSVALSNLGLIYEEFDEIEKAQNAYLRSLKIKTNYPALYNLGVLYRKIKQIEKSTYYLEKARELNPNNSYVNYSLGMSYLMEKNFEKGYPLFLNRPVRHIEHLKNFWNGEKYSDKKILVFCEYGLGDAIMFSRYFPLLKEYFASVVVVCQSELISIFESSFSDIEFVSQDANVEYDYCVLAMDIPFLTKMDFNSIPLPEGYLRIDEEKVAEFKGKYFDNNLLKVGIFYLGGEQEKRNARFRAIELKKLTKLMCLDGVQLYSFQKDDKYGELNEFPQIIDLGKDFRDFSDTAAAMKNLDVMVTIDSAPVHLAGALGIKTFLMLPKYSEWRWFLDEKNTPWYKSVELFRQSDSSCWDNVVEDVFDKLSTLKKI